MAAIFTGLGVFLLGNISGYEAKKLLADSLSGLNILCNTVILASVTILALLLTLLGVSTGSGSDLKARHYDEVLNIAKIDTVLLIAVLILFQFFNIPIVESGNVPIAWFRIIYWATLLFSSLISGMMITVVLMLFGTISNMINIIGLRKDHPLVSDSKNKEIEDWID